MAETFSPDGQHLATGAGTATAQTAVPRQYTPPGQIGYVNTPPPDASDANAGNPGSWMPLGCWEPNSSDLSRLPTPSVPAAWLTGEFVYTIDGGQVYWDGTAWVAGRAP